MAAVASSRWMLHIGGVWGDSPFHMWSALMSQKKYKCNESWTLFCSDKKLLQLPSPTPYTLRAQLELCRQRLWLCPLIDKFHHQLITATVGYSSSTMGLSVVYSRLWKNRTTGSQNFNYMRVAPCGHLPIIKTTAKI